MTANLTPAQQIAYLRSIREPSVAMYNAALNYLKGKCTCWCVDDVYQAMIDTLIGEQEKKL